MDNDHNELSKRVYKVFFYYSWRQGKLIITVILYFETGIAIEARIAMVPVKKIVTKTPIFCNVYDFWTKRMSRLILVSCNFWKHLEEMHIMVTLFWCVIVQF